MFLVPESPACLMSVGKEEEAIKSLEWLCEALERKKSDQKLRN